MYNIREIFLAPSQLCIQHARLRIYLKSDEMRLLQNSFYTLYKISYEIFSVFMHNDQSSVENRFCHHLPRHLIVSKNANLHYLLDPADMLKFEFIANFSINC